MILKIAIGVGIALVLFLAFVATREGYFRYERSGVIKAPAEKVFPYISQFKLGHQWSPYEKGVEMPKTFGGTDGAVGAWMEFGPSKSGSGRLEVLEVIPNELVKMQLHMTAPFEAKNIVTYKLAREEAGTKFTWSMEGDGGFLGKLMSVLIDCEKMVGGQMSEGINNLKSLIEGKAATASGGQMNLTEKPEFINVPAQHYLYIEKIGPFEKTAKACWDELHSLMKNSPASAKKTGAMALFKMGPQMVYRAGFSFAEKPTEIPKGLQYIHFEGGKYAKFVLKGSYMNLGPAWGQTIENAEKNKLPKRDDFFIENYANDPATTPEDQLISELMIPTK